MTTIHTVHSASLKHVCFASDWVAIVEGGGGGGGFSLNVKAVNFNLSQEMLRNTRRLPDIPFLDTMEPLTMT